MASLLWVKRRYSEAENLYECGYILGGCADAVLHHGGGVVHAGGDSLVWLLRCTALEFGT